jgi:hypothetical protein
MLDKVQLVVLDVTLQVLQGTVSAELAPPW